MPSPSRRHFAARPDRAEPDDARGATGELPGAVPLVGDLAARVHLVGAHVVIGGHDEAVRREQQRDRDLGDGVGVATGRAQHRDPRLGGGLDVDVVGVAPARADELQRQVEHRPLHRVGLDDEDVGALLDEPGRELLAVVEPQRDVLDPGVVHHVGQRVERVPALAAERRGHQRLVSFGHAASSHVADAGVRFGRPVSNVSAVPIHYEQDADHVVLITIDRPEARNAADMEHFKALREAWERFAADDQAWVAIITGVGEAFFAGADLKTYVPEITKFQKQIAEKGLTEINGYRLDDGTRAVLRNWPLYKPVIAAVNGFCTAGGMEMLGGCDIRVACPEAKFAVMEPKRGLFAGGGTTVRLPRQIPWPQAMEFLLCADLIPAERAYEMGLLNAIVPRDQLLDKAREYAARMIANAPLAVQATKQSALQGLYVDEDAITQVRAAARALRAALEQIDGADPATAQGAIAASVEVLTKLGKELRTAFEKESQHLERDLPDRGRQGRPARRSPRSARRSGSAK